MKKYTLWTAAFLLLVLSCLGCQKTEPPAASKDDSSQKERSITAEERKTASILLKDIKELERQGRSMESLRREETIGNLKKCGQMMRERQGIADELYGRAESLPQPFAFHLGVAATELKLCVSCLSTAKESCDRVKTALSKAREEIDQVAQNKAARQKASETSETNPQTANRNTGSAKQSDATERFGKWRDESEPKITNSIIEIYREGRKYYLNVKFDQSDKDVTEEPRKEGPGKFRRLTHPGDYYVVTKLAILNHATSWDSSLQQGR